MSMKRLTGRLTAGAVALTVLFVSLCATTLALVYATLISQEADITTGKVEISVNGGAPIITEGEFEFEAGTTAQKTFYIQNNSTCAVYYRLYFSDINGTLADDIVVTISKGETHLYAGKLSDLTEKGKATDDVLLKGESRELVLTLHLPKEVGKAAEGGTLSFTLNADAVQAPNNDDKVFE